MMHDEEEEEEEEGEESVTFWPVEQEDCRCSGSEGLRVFKKSTCNCDHPSKITELA